MSSSTTPKQDIITTANEALKASERSNIPIDKLLYSNIYKSDSDSNTQSIKTPSTIVSSDGDKNFLPPKLSPIESNYKNEQNPNLKIVSKILKMDNSNDLNYTKSKVSSKNSLTSGGKSSNGVKSADEQQLLFDARFCEKKIELLKKELTESLSENKNLLSSQELLTKENHKLRLEIANLHASYNSVLTKTKSSKTKSSNKNYNHQVENFEKEIQKLSDINHQLKVQQEIDSTQFNRLKKFANENEILADKFKNENEILKNKILKIQDTFQDMVEKAKRAENVANDRVLMMENQITSLNKYYNIKKEDNSCMVELCKKLTENVANDRREIQRLREEKIEMKKLNLNKPEESRETLSENVLNLYPPAVSKSQKDLILNVVATQKRALNRIKHLNMENKNLKFELSKAERFKNNNLKISKNILPKEQEGLKIWEKLENEKLNTNRALSELAQVEQELDNLRVERALDKLQVYELTKSKSELDNKLKTDMVSSIEQDQNKKFINQLSQKVINLENQCQILKKMKIDKPKTVSSFNIASNKKFQKFRKAIKVLKDEILDKDAKIENLESVVKNLKFQENCLKNKTLMYEKKLSGFGRELDEAVLKLKTSEENLKGKQSEINQLEKVTKSLSNDMEKAMNHMSKEIAMLQQSKIDTTVKTRVENSDYESDASSNTSFISANSLSDSIQTPSAVSRTAKHILKANLPDNSIEPLIQRTKAAVIKSPTRTSHKRYNRKNEIKLLNRRIFNLTRALEITKNNRDNLEQQVSELQANFNNESIKNEHLLNKEKCTSNLLKHTIEKAEKLQSQLEKANQNSEKLKTELDSRWSKKEQEIREQRLKCALQTSKQNKQIALDADKVKNEIQQENLSLKDRITNRNEQILRQKQLVDESKLRLNNEKIKTENAVREKNEIGKQLEQQVLDINHKKIYICNLKRQLNLLKEKIVKFESETENIKGQLIATTAEKAKLQDRLTLSKQKLLETNKIAETNILELEKSTKSGIEDLKTRADYADLNAQEFALTLIAIADQVVIKLAKQRNIKANKIESDIRNLEEKLKIENEQIRRRKEEDNESTSSNLQNLNKKAQHLAMSILDISAQDLTQIITGKDESLTSNKNYIAIQQLEVEAKMIRCALSDDLIWQEKFVRECRSKKNESSHTFCEYLCKNLCDKVDDLVLMAC